MKRLTKYYITTVLALGGQLHLNAQTPTDQEYVDAEDAAIRGEFAAADTAIQNDVDQNELDSDAADTAIRGEFAAEDAAIRGEFAAADTAIQNDVDQNEADSDAADTAIRGEFAAEDAAIRGEFAAEDDAIRGELAEAFNADELKANHVGIAGTITRNTVTGEIHIGENSLITNEVNSVQELYAQGNREDGSFGAIDIVVTNGSDLVVRTEDPDPANSIIGISSGLTPQIDDPDSNDAIVPVVTTLDGIGSEKIDYTNSGARIAQNGDVTLSQSSGTQLNLELATVTSFNVDSNTGMPVTDINGDVIQVWRAGYYTDANGNIVSVTDFAAAVLADSNAAGNYTFNDLFEETNDPRFENSVSEAELLTQLGNIEPDDAVFDSIVGADGEPLVSQTTLPGTGGNLQVGGNANIDGVLSVGSVTDVAQAIADNIAAIDQEVIDRTNGDNDVRNEFAAADALMQADVDQNEADSDAADTAIRGEFAASDAAIQADVDQNELDSDAADTAIRGEFAAEDAAIRGEFAAEDAAIRGEFAAEDAAIRGEFAAADAAIRNDFIAADAALQTQIDTNRAAIDRNARGIAMVAAMTHTTVLPGMTHALDVSAAHFEGETGMAISYSRLLSDGVQINFGAASTTDFEESVVRAGIGYQW